MSQFEPIQVANLEEGEFLAALQAETDRLSAFLAAYRREHGDKALKAKGKIVAEITFSIENVDDGAYGIKTQIKRTEPARPPAVSIAIEAENPATGARAIFTRSTGSSHDDPRQEILSTRDGRTVVGGEVVEDDDE